tara:strand:+ start:43 stop:777 length:735 start_codon:yes stop_codon:yes gene_type:complete
VASLIQGYKMSALTKQDLVNPALDNHYQVYISGMPKALQDLLNSEKYGKLEKDWYNQYVGVLCTEATLPTSSFATAEVKDNFQGITQQFAHTRLYVDSEFTFYVDKKYKMLKFFEGWMDYISGTIHHTKTPETNTRGYYRKFNYPLGDPTSSSQKATGGYKVDTLSITKFEKDFQTSKDYLTYEFVNAFPKGMTSMQVKYGSAELLKVSVQFGYDRYIVSHGLPQRGNNSIGANDLIGTGSNIA